MIPSNISLNLETLRPRLVDGVLFIDAGPYHFFLKNVINATYVKLTKEEAILIQTFDGTKTLPDILQEQIENSGTKYFRSTINAIEKLNQEGFLIDGPLSEVSAKSEEKSSHGRFDNAVLQFIASVFISIPSIALLTVCGIIGFLFSTNSHGGNIFLAFALSPTAGEQERIISYTLGLIILWMTLMLIVNIKNLLSAFALSYHQCQVLHPRLQFKYGLFFFDCELTDIVTAGNLVVTRLFAMRMGFPLLFMPICMALSYFWTFSEIVRQACWFVFLFSISPLLESEMTQYVYYITEFGAGGRPLHRFLRKKFLIELFSWRGEMRAQEYFLGMSAWACLWLYFVYAAFWNIFLSSFTGLAMDFMAGGLLMKTLTGMYFVIIIIPLVTLLAVFISIGISNAMTMTGSPLHRLNQLGKKIASRNTIVTGELTKFLREIPLFSKLNENEMSVLTSRLRIVRLRPGERAVTQGEEGDSFYCIVSGKLNVIIEDEYCREHILNELGPGSSFGEIALLERMPRTASVVAVKSSTLIELKRNEFDEFVVRSAGGGEKVTDMIRISKMIMEGRSILSHLTPCQVNHLIAMLKRETRKAGDIIFRYGEPGDRFYIINKGKVFVDPPGAENSARRLTLVKGEFFGEIALIKNIPRTATLIAAEEVELLYLTKNEFYYFLQHNARIGMQFDEIIDKRIIENKYFRL
ncbi:membrane hypothetical protein [Gammaproteobacteria bacterium]